VSLRLVSTEREQRLAHPLGVAALVAAQIPSPAKYVEQHLTPAERLGIASLPYKNLDSFVADVILASADRQIAASAEGGLVFTRTQFEQIRDAVQASIVDLCFATAGLAAKIAQAAKSATKAIGEVKAFDLLSVLTAEKAHIAELLHPGFVRSTGLDRLPRVEIYLKAIAMRIERLAENPMRDRVAASELDQAIGIFTYAGGAIPLATNAKPELVAARWMLEELRVSLFAQTLGTAESVSVQRIKKVLG
jgi:ATP-dependent helicase HrpA